MINNNISYYLTLTFRVRPLRGIAQFLRHRHCSASCERIAPFRVVAPCPAPQKPHTSPRPATGFRMNPLELVTRLRTFLPPEAVLYETEDLRPYECDGLSAYRQMPMIVALPQTEEEVVRDSSGMSCSENPGSGARGGHWLVRRCPAPRGGCSTITRQTETHTRS